MRFIHIIILTLVAVSTFAQADSITRELLNDVIKRKTDTSVIGYLDKIPPLLYDNMQRHVRNRKIWDLRQKKYVIKLSKHEQKAIVAQLSMARETVWENNLFPQSERILDDKVREYLNRYPSREVCIFSKPIFIRNNTIALLYLVRLCCGGIYGPMETSFFKKTKDGWKQWAIVDGGVF